MMAVGKDRELEPIRELASLRVGLIESGLTTIKSTPPIYGVTFKGVTSMGLLMATEMEKEKQVILREMDMSHDDPALRSARRLFETAYTKSPYPFPIIGCPHIYQAVRREDVLA